MSTDDGSLRPSKSPSSTTVDHEKNATHLSCAEAANNHLPIEIPSNIDFSHPYHPIHWPLWKKWSLATIYCGLEVFVTIRSTDYLSVLTLVQEKWGGSIQVVTLGQSMFIIGAGCGPIILGPLSDIWGRKWVYVWSTYLYALVNIGAAIPTSLPMLIVFMFLSGATGSVAECNVAGTIADLFGDDAGAGQAMGLFVACASIGPTIGSPVGAWFAQDPKLGLPWTGWINVIIGTAYATGMALLPETLPSIVIPRTAMAEDGLELELPKRNALEFLTFTLTMALKILLYEPIVLSLSLFNGFIYGLGYLFLESVIYVFVDNYRLSYIDADLTFLSLGAGVVIMLVFLAPVQTWLVQRDRRKNGGKTRPEARFLLSLVTVWGFPISMFWFAWTSAPGLGHTSYWSPICAGNRVALLGIVNPLLWLGILNYVTDSYPNLAGSAIAATIIPSFAVGAGCAHLGIYMFDRLSAQTAISILGAVSMGVVVLIYVMYFFGPVLRARSRYARKF
ncbi:putative vitamin B6 transporter [Cantharellus anzutake]|uniref:putative vitamin B6 transporter n=1 Tax=Cantharellus anzutake TaxID=1750568 RepID=UPI0019087196|nr:putative vitamin B6 transporter [Cantharellus anzutake]KAF8342979.1 putative vitamin B6 transporter [Cantharellus anzutake]